MKDELKKLTKTLWQLPLVRFFIISWLLLTIEATLIDMTVPAYFASNLFLTLVGFQLSIYSFIKIQHNIFKVIFAASILFTLFHAIKSIINVFTWIF